MRILIVDDSKPMRMLVSRALRLSGIGNHTVEEAANGVEALQAIKRSLPDVVLSDWNMPEMNGYELLQALRAENISVPFGFVTSESTPEMRRKGTDAGALFLITKPFSPERFQEALAPLANPKTAH